jgi:hypothetical protein
MNSIAKWKHHHTSGRRSKFGRSDLNSITVLLARIGVPSHLLHQTRGRPKHGHFFSQPTTQLWNILETARGLYRSRVRSGELDAELNVSWARVRELFSAHGITME